MCSVCLNPRVNGFTECSLAEPNVILLLFKIPTVVLLLLLTVRTLFKA